MSTTPIPNRAGMICFNRAGEVLLVSALGKPSCWVFPKGHIEQGEASYEAAEREVLEEARVHATCDWGSPIGVDEYDYKGEHVVVEWWTGMGIELVAPPHDDEIAWGFREAKWVKWQVALDLLSFPSQRNLLRRALCVEEMEELTQLTLTDPKEVV